MRMKPLYMRILISFFIFSLLTDLAMSQVNIIELIKEVKRSSVSIEKIHAKEDIKKHPKPALLGSGFLTRKEGVNYAVTNNHVIRDLINEEILLVGINHERGKIFYRANVIKKDTIRDVAILSLSSVYFVTSDIDTNNFNVNYVSTQTSLFADTNQIQEGMSVLIIGYPLGIGRELIGNRPVSRVGIVAQSVTENGTFLIDGIASHGNSGSPVFSTQPPVKFLGMVVSFPNERIDLYDNNGELVAALPYNSGLTVCISAKVILSLLP